MCSRNLLTRRRENITPRRGRNVPQQRFWVLHLGLEGDVVDTYDWDVLVTYHWNVVGCFIWDLFDTSWRRTNGTSLLRPFETSLRRSNKLLWRPTTETFWRRSIEPSLGVSFGTYLRRRWDVQRDVVTTSPGRLNAGWVVDYSFKDERFCLYLGILSYVDNYIVISFSENLFKCEKY